MDHTKSSGMSEWLTVAGFIVTVSALSQVAFAVVAYVEAATLREKVQEVTNALERLKHKNTESLQSLNSAYCIAARASIQAMMTAMMSLDPGERYDAAMSNLRLAQIEVDLANGTYPSLWSAIQNCLKLGKNNFIELQERIWDRSRCLLPEEKKRIRSDYKSILKNILKD